MTAIEDGLVEGDETLSLTLKSVTYGGYAHAFTAQSLPVVIEDNDRIGLVVAETDGGTTVKSGQDDSFTVALATQPTADVHVWLQDKDPPARKWIAASPGELIFTTANWNQPQTVEVTSIEAPDGIPAGQPTHEIGLQTSSTDTRYAYEALGESRLAVTVVAPDIAALGVTGQGVEIANLNDDSSGDGTDSGPSTANGTDFGVLMVGSANPEQSSLVRIFSITNSGTIPLQFNATPILIAGEAAGDFQVLEAPPAGTPFPPGATADIRILFHPSAPGLRSARLNIRHTNGQYAFAIQGIGTVNVSPQRNPEVVLGTPLVGASYRDTDTPLTVQITYQDLDGNLDVGTIGASDLTIRREDGDVIGLRPAAVTLDGCNGYSCTATYKIQPSGGSWGPGHSGLYRVDINPNEIRDTEHASVTQETEIARVQVDLEPPFAHITNDPNPTLMGFGGSIYRVDVRYTDSGTGVDRSSIDPSDLMISPHLPFLGLQIDPPAPDGSVSAHYDFSPPGGTWDASDAGTYMIAIPPTRSETSRATTSR